MNFMELYNRVAPRLKRIALHYKNRCPSMNEEDLYQEMSCYLWDKFKDAPATEGMNDYYIAKGCEFHILNFIRVHKQKAQLYSLEEPINEKGDTIGDVLPDTSAPLDRDIERRMAFDAIMNNGFTKREKEVLSVLLKGYTVREAGQRLGISHVMVVKAKNNLIKKWQRKETRLPKI